MKLFIGCASSNDVPEFYLNDCKILIDKLLKENDLVYGAYNEGLMGICYESAKENNNKVFGKCVSVDKEYLDNIDCDSKEVYETIMDRTKSLVYESDAVIILPGGIGTLNELFATIDSKRTGLFDKPIIIYNSNHYYDELLSFLDKLYNEKFSPIDVKNTYYVTDDKEKVLSLLKKGI